MINLAKSALINATGYYFVSESVYQRVDNERAYIFINSGWTKGVIDEYGIAYEYLDNAEPPVTLNGIRALEIKAITANFFIKNSMNIPSGFEYLTHYVGLRTSNDLRLFCSAQSAFTSIGCVATGRVIEVDALHIGGAQGIELHKSGRCKVNFDRLDTNSVKNIKTKSILREMLLEKIGTIPKGFEFIKKYKPLHTPQHQ